MKFAICPLPFAISVLTTLTAGALTTPALPQPQAANQPTATEAIPDRPEKLTFPKLSYEPPAPEKYRVQLKSGPVAYVVPDRELPLVNFVIFVRTGQYVEPADKQGVAEL